VIANTPEACAPQAVRSSRIWCWQRAFRHNTIAAYGTEKRHEKSIRGVRGWFSFRMRGEKWGSE
jgi:hypothetical protein